MIWANFLHIYQPANQVPEILERVTSECYWPLIESLLDHPKARITLNINAALTERLDKKLIEGLKKVAERGQIEFTGSAKYHALLPFLPVEEIERQIVLNTQTNQKILGEVYQPKGFFPPEMAYSPKIVPVIEKLGYQWIILDEIARNGQIGQIGPVGQIRGSSLKVFFRERGPSNLIMSAMVRRQADLKHFLKDYGQKEYLVTGMDGETFGHHRPGLQSLLTELLISSEFEHKFFAELLDKYPAEEVSPKISTWASSQKDIKDGIQFISWNDPSNEIHKLQWQLQKLVLNDPKSDREKLDRGLASDQFFWASAKPWWSLEQIELGAWTLLEALHTDQTYELYLKIIAKAFEWQRTGKVRDLSHQMKEAPRIPFKDKTATEPWIYQAFMKMLKDAQEEAAKKENYEEAILWRDAIWKIETKNDIFDAVHAIDLLRRQAPDTKIREVLDKYTADYKNLVSGQPEQRDI